MMELQNKMHSISVHFLILLFCAALSSGACFLAGHYTFSYLIDSSIYTGEYQAKKTEKYIQSLQNYIDSNHIALKECQKLNKWIKKQQIISLSVYNDNKKIFDSDYPEHDFWMDEVEEAEYEWVTYHRLQFEDGTARVGMSGIFEYQLYNYALLIEILVSFLLFIGIVLAGIRYKIEYIKTLSKEIEILENGGLEYEITICGEDELSALAKGLDKMRLSFVNMMERESEMIKENQKIITEMSHDLRTPVTSMLLFLEVMKKEDYRDYNMVKEYTKKLEQKTLHIKQLTDHLFKYTLLDRQEGTDLQTLTFRDSFFDPLSELCAYLEKNGFSINMQVEWFWRPIKNNMEFQTRILDNITSNILKYADPMYPIEISSFLYAEMVSLKFKNTVQSTNASEEERYGVGLKSIKNMMHMLGGEGRHSVQNGIFSVELLFPIIGQNQDVSKTISL